MPAMHDLQIFIAFQACERCESLVSLTDSYLGFPLPSKIMLWEANDVNAIGMNL